MNNLLQFREISQYTFSFGKHFPLYTIDTVSHEHINIANGKINIEFTTQVLPFQFMSHLAIHSAPDPFNGITVIRETLVRCLKNGKDVEYEQNINNATISLDFDSNWEGNNPPSYKITICGYLSHENLDDKCCLVKGLKAMSTYKGDQD